MTQKDQDPFERLSRLDTPQPDPARQAAAVAASTRLFAQEEARAAAPGKARPPRFASWLAGAYWLRPASAIGLAAIAALVVVPLVRPPEVMPPADAMAEMEVPVPPEPIADGFSQRMGAVPRPMASPTTLSRGGETDIERYDFGGVTLALRTGPQEVALYLVVDGAERQIALFPRNGAETLTLSDAFWHTATDETVPILLVRSGFIGADQHWDVFTAAGEGYRHADTLSLAIRDAPDRAAAIARLEEGGP